MYYVTRLEPVFWKEEVRRTAEIKGKKICGLEHEAPEAEPQITPERLSFSSLHARISYAK